MDEYYPQQQNGYQPVKAPTPLISTISMGAGALSLLLFCCIWKYDVVLCLPAIVLGIIGLKKEENGKGMAIAGIICGAIALMLVVACIVVYKIFTKTVINMGSAGFYQFLSELYERFVEQ